MAAALVRKLALRSVRVISQRQKLLHLNKTFERKIHLSPAVWQKYFSEKHEWVDLPEGANVATIGITDYAQDKLGDVVFIQLPEKGQELEADSEAGVLESVKAASDIFSPVTGEITDVNDNVVEAPSLVNSSPYGDGWLFKMTIANPSELEDLMDEAGYKEYLETVE